MAEKTDVIYLNNGDRITCEIKSLDRGQLRVSTDSMGTIYIEWTDIDRVVSDQSLQLEMDTGERTFGKLTEAEQKRNLNVDVLDHSETVAMDKVVRMEPIEIGKSFWRRFDGSVSAGLDFEKANSLLKWNLAADAALRTREYQFRLNTSWNLTSQDNVEDSERASLGATYQRFLRDRWYRIYLANAERNDETGINLRMTGGVGIGRYFRQTNSTLIGWTAGLAVTNEETISSADDVTNIEGILRADWSVFRYKSPEIDFDSALTILPVLSDIGRVRSNLDVNLRRELIEDLFFNVNFYGTYDNEPPMGADKEDYGIVTSLGYAY